MSNFLIQIKELISELSVHVTNEGAKFRHGGIYGQACSRSSHFGAFSGCRVGPGVVPELRLRTLWLRLHSYGSSLRLCRSSLGGTASVRATDLHTTTLRTDSCLPGAARGARLLHSAISGRFTAVI